LELFTSLNWAGAKNPIRQKQNYWPRKLLSTAQGSLPWGSDGKSPAQFLPLVPITWSCCNWRSSGNMWRSLSSEDFDEWGIPLYASNYIAEEYHRGHYIVSSQVM